MSERDDYLAMIATQLTDACPTRVITRSLKDPAQHKAADLLAGVLTLVSSGEGNYQNLNGRLGLDAIARAALIGQIKVAENAESLAIEQAELTLFEEVLNALRTGPDALRCLDLKDFRQSAQLEHPYGWFVLELEWAT